VNELIDAVWIEKREKVSIESLAKISGLSEAELCALVEFGALAPLNPDETEWLFAPHCVVTVRTAGRLRQAFDLEPDALALTLSLVERIRDLQEELRRLRVTVPHRSS
jgi:chaperone modulatory protein CbpM